MSDIILIAYFPVFSEISDRNNTNILYKINKSAVKIVIKSESKNITVNQNQKILPLVLTK